MLEIDENGKRCWKNEYGELHREDGPAIEKSNGDKEWYLNGFMHMEDGPACEYNDGDKEWYLNGFMHMEDGPACEYNEGSKCWYLNGERHRVDGPAIEWWLKDQEYTKEEYKRKVREIC